MSSNTLMSSELTLSYLDFPIITLTIFDNTVHAFPPITTADLSHLDI